MIFCHCTGVSDSTIDKLIEEGAVSLEQIIQQCGAGAHCLPCKREICKRLGTMQPEEPAAPALQPLSL